MPSNLAASVTSTEIIPSRLGLVLCRISFSHAASLYDAKDMSILR